MKYGRNDNFYANLLKIFLTQNVPGPLLAQMNAALHNMSTGHATFMKQHEIRKRMCSNETLLFLLYKNYYYDFEVLGFKMEHACA